MLPPVDPADLNLAVAAAALTVLAAVVAVRVSTRVGLPTLLIYLGLGLFIGEAGLGFNFEDPDVTQTLGLLALAVILAEGGLTTNWRIVRPVIAPSAVLASLGVAISVAVTASITYLLLDVDVRTAVLLGAVVSSTDAAAVFSVLRRLQIRRRMRATLEAESGFNDPPVIILVSVVISDAWERANWLLAFGDMLFQLTVGAVVGLVIARIGQTMLARSALPVAGLYPLATMAIALLAFAAAGAIGASGFTAVYVAGLWLGNAPLPHRNSTLGFAEGLAWLAQIGLFVLLGLLASPARLADALLPALIVGGVLLLVARPLSVVVCVTPFRVPLREQVFMSWAGLRGAVPIVLATLPLSAGLPAASFIFDVVFLLVVVFTLVQAPVLPFVARMLGVDETTSPLEVDFESAPLETLGGSLLQFTIPPQSRLHGVWLDELRLPKGAAVTLVVRDDHTLTPDRNTVLSAGDHLLLVVTEDVLEQTERRLRAVSRAGRLAEWHGESGDEEDPRKPRRARPD